MQLPSSVIYLEQKQYKLEVQTQFLFDRGKWLKVHIYFWQNIDGCKM